MSLGGPGQKRWFDKLTSIADLTQFIAKVPDPSGGLNTGLKPARPF